MWRKIIYKIKRFVYYKETKFPEECFNSVTCYKDKHSVALRELRNAIRNMRLQQSENKYSYSIS